MVVETFFPSTYTVDPPSGMSCAAHCPLCWPLSGSVISHTCKHSTHGSQYTCLRHRRCTLDRSHCALRVPRTHGSSGQAGGSMATFRCGCGLVFTPVECPHGVCAEECAAEACGWHRPDGAKPVWICYKCWHWDQQERHQSSARASKRLCGYCRATYSPYTDHMMLKAAEAAAQGVQWPPPRPTAAGAQATLAGADALTASASSSSAPGVARPAPPPPPTATGAPQAGPLLWSGIRQAYVGGAASIVLFYGSDLGHVQPGGLPWRAACAA